MSQVVSGEVHLLSSDVLLFELRQNPDPVRRDFGVETLNFGVSLIRISSQIIRRAHQLNQKNISSLDSLHLASAEHGHADYFCTCDDSFYKKAVREVSGTTQVVRPHELEAFLQ